MGVDVVSIIPIGDSTGVPPPALVEPDGQADEAFGSAIVNALLALAGAAPSGEVDASAAVLLPDLAGQTAATEGSTPDEAGTAQAPSTDDPTKPVPSALIRVGPLEWALSADVVSTGTSGAEPAAASPTAPDGRVSGDAGLPDGQAPTGQPGRIPVPEGTPGTFTAEPRVPGADEDVAEALPADGLRSRSLPANTAVAVEHPDVPAVDAEQAPAPTPNTPAELRAVRSGLTAASSPAEANVAAEVSTPEGAVVSVHPAEAEKEASTGTDGVERRALGSLVARLGTSPGRQSSGADAAVAGPPEPVASRDVPAQGEASPSGGSADGEAGPSEREADRRSDTGPAPRAAPSHLVAARLAPYVDIQNVHGSYGPGEHEVGVESVAHAAPVHPVRMPTEVFIRAEVPAAGAVFDLGGDATLASGPDSVVRAVRLMWRDGLGEARLQLQPERLGTVLVSLRIEDGVVSASVRAETPAALQWLQAHQHDLRAALNAQGLDFDRFLSADEHPGAGHGQEQNRRRDPESRRQRSSDHTHSSGRRFEVTV